MSGGESARLSKAKEFLRQAQGLDADHTPEPVIHLSYYAMFHAALAVLEARVAEPPTKHRGVIVQFARITRDMGEAQRGAARSLRVAYDRRLVADYDIEAPSLSVDAAETRDAAAVFLGVCEGLLGGSL